MAWYKVATAPDLNSLQNQVPENYQSIPLGKRIRIVVNTSPFPVAPIFNVAGAELAAKLLKVGGKLIDVYGNGAFEIVFEIESVAAMSSHSHSKEASMALPQVVVIIAIIAAVLALLPLVTKLATMLANFVPSSGGSSGGGLVDYVKALFGDYTPIVFVAAGVIILVLLLRGSGRTQAPVIYNIPGGTTKAET